MSRSPRHAVAVDRSPRRRAVTSVGALLLGLFALVVGGAAAYASWSASGTGTGFATVGTLAAPTSVTSSSTYSTVAVGWVGVTPPSGTLTGYYVTRYSGATPSNACGTDPATPGTWLSA
jgi:hypothetical protein